MSIETVVGAALGPADLGANQHEGSLAGEASTIPKNDRHRFRLIAPLRLAGFAGGTMGQAEPR